MNLLTSKYYIKLLDTSLLINNIISIQAGWLLLESGPICFLMAEVPWMAFIEIIKLRLLYKYESSADFQSEHRF